MSDVEQIVTALVRERARRSLPAFIRYLSRDYIDNWHHRVLMRVFEKWAFGDLQNVMVFMPPRHGKSEIVSRYGPALVLGQDPDAGVLASAYADSLASSFNRDVQRIIDRPRYARLFPETQLFDSNVRTISKGTWLRNSDEFEIVNHKGFYKSAGVGSGITGRGFSHGIIDDPIKGAKQAHSRVEREALWDWYQGDFLTRRNDENARVLLTMTRWHADDLAGRLLRLEPSRWHVVEFPAIADEQPRAGDPRESGEALWPERFSRKFFDELPGGLQSSAFRSLYQQRPPSTTGRLFHRSLLGKYHKLGSTFFFEDGEVLRLADLTCFATVDLATSERQAADYTVVTIWGMSKSGKLVLLDVERQQIGGGKLLALIESTRSRWPVHEVYVERMGFQLNLIQQAVERGLPYRELRPDKDKISRCAFILSLIDLGSVHVDKDAHYLPTVLAELEAFPSSDAGVHDDIVDCVAYAGLVCERKRKAAGGLANIYDLSQQRGDEDDS